MATWAAGDPVDLSKATITFEWGTGDGSSEYSGAAITDPTLPTTISIKAEGAAEATAVTVSGSGLTLSWVNANDVAATGAMKDAGKYYVQVAAGTSTAYTGTGKTTTYFEITPLTLNVEAKSSDVEKVYGFDYQASKADFYNIVAGTAATKFANDGGVSALGHPVEALYADNNAGTKTFTIVGNTFKNYVVAIAESKKTGTLVIDKRPLKVIAADKECNYKDGTVIDGANWNYTYSTVTGGENEGFIAADLEEDGITPKSGVLTFSAAVIKNQNSLELYNGNAGVYSVTPTVTSANYLITTQAGTLRVIPRNLDAEGLVFTLSGFDTYNGYDQTPTLTVTDNGETVPATQFVVKYKVLNNGTPTGDELAAIKEAGDYRAYITAAPTASNYAGNAVEKNINLKKASLIAKFLGYTKIYDGQAISTDVLNGEGCLYVDGYLGNDTKATVFPTGHATYKMPTVTYTNVNATSATGDDVKPAEGVAKNYDFLYQPGKLIIKKAKVKISLKDVAADYGTPAATPTQWTNLITDIGANSTKTAADVNFTKFVDKLYIQTGVDAHDVPVYNTTAVTTENLFTVLAKTAVNHKVGTVNELNYNYIKGSTITRAAGTNADDYELNAEFTADAFTKNYEFGEVVKATFTINPAGLIVQADPKNKTYGEADPELTYTAPAELTDADKENITISRVPGKNVGTYTITVSGPAVIGNHAITYKTAPFIITKANLKVTAKNQALYTGQKVDDLDEKAFETTGLVAEDKQDIEDALVFAFATTGTGAVAVSNETGHVGELTLASGDYTTYVKGIEIALDDDANNAAATRIRQNYYPTLVYGDLTVLRNDAQTLILNRPLRPAWDADADDIAKDLIEANDGETRRVTFGDFTMYAEKWYAMVLPFNTSVAEVSQKFGYAVVDLMDNTNNRNAVSFKLYMQDIAANTPFLIKVYKQMNMNTVVFSSKEIVNPEDADLVQTDAFGNKFTGTYTAKNADWLTGQDYLFSVNKDNDKYGPAVNGEDAASTSYLNPVCAYITYKNVQNTSAPIIYIEEPGGSTTAISVVNAQVVKGDVDGWYTVNGMKLEGVPTQKGIYINNGKKVVIK